MLTDLQIQRLKTEKGKTKRHADRDGLALEVRSSGKKVFIFRFQWDKKPQTMTLGDYPSLTLAEARNLAITHRDSINKGIDPRQKYTAAEVRLTFKIVAEQWFKKYKGSWKEVALKRHSKSLTQYILPIIGDKPIDEVTKVELLQIIRLHEERGHHDVAHRVYARLKAIFEFAVGSSLTNNYPFIGLHKALIPRPKTTNQPAINSNEAHELLAAIRSSEVSNVIKIYLELLAHLFSRPAELRLAQWSEFNLHDEEWHIPSVRMKMGVSHWVPLSPKSLKLLKELRLITGFTPYLFNSPTTKKNQPISETSVRKLLHNLGFKNRHTAHGFRSLASSVLHEQGNFRSDAIEAQLSHRVQGVRGVYLRADFRNERRDLMNWYSDWLQGENNNLVEKNKLVEDKQ